MYLRRAIAFAFALVATFATARAHAWQEAHEAGDDVDIHVAPDGIASVQHRIRWHVVHGPLRSIDLLDFEVPAASVDPNVEVTAEDGHKLTARVTPVEERRDAKRVAQDCHPGLLSAVPERLSSEFSVLMRTL